MGNRLNPTLNALNSEKQSAFIEGRLLTDNALIAYEINHYIHRKTQGKVGVAGLKVDISKVYDRLEWSFIEMMLESFLRNGEIFGEVVPQRGVRQEDPISPYLYILCVEGLSVMIRKHEECGLLHGCRLQIMHQLSLIYSLKMTATSFLKKQSKKHILKSVLQSPNTSDEDRVEVCDSLEVRNKTEVFGFFIGRVQQRLKGRYNNELSRSRKFSAVMKPKDYPNSSFLDAEVGTNPSYIWRSILASIEVFKAGARKRIGNGRDICVWGVPWLSEVNNGYVMTPMHVQLHDKTIYSLMQDDER
ncbi:uncharacterized protein LOC141701175 [Apium graveolens]|uniref:uncharacterized protein LOC141701175 n=1 Tax=Apium graveolens TaxID=4045 RepID=UPI003D790A95